MSIQSFNLVMKNEIKKINKLKVVKPKHTKHCNDHFNPASSILSHVGCKVDTGYSSLETT